MAKATKEKEGIGYLIWTHKTLFFIIALFAAVAILVIRIQSYQANQEKMQQQLAQQTEQLDRQNLLIKEWQDKNGTADTKETVPVITSETIKTQLNSLNELTTQEYVYTNADKRESTAKWLFGWERPFSGKSILITYDGTIKAGINLSQVEIAVDEESHTITVTLPKSTITDNIIPQESISIVEVKNGLFNDVTFDNYNEFISEQKIIMEQKAKDQGLLEKADEEAKSLVKSFLSVLPGMDAYTLTVQ